MFGRWKSFRVLLDRIGEVRSILLLATHVLALTATATQTLRSSISRTIGMRNPVVIEVSPCKKNIVYSVGKLDDVITVEYRQSAPHRLSAPPPYFSTSKELVS